MRRVVAVLLAIGLLAMPQASALASTTPPWSCVGPPQAPPIVYEAIYKTEGGIGGYPINGVKGALTDLDTGFFALQSCTGGIADGSASAGVSLSENTFGSGGDLVQIGIATSTGYPPYFWYVPDEASGGLSYAISGVYPQIGHAYEFVIENQHPPSGYVWAYAIYDVTTGSTLIWNTTVPSLQHGHLFNSGTIGWWQFEGIDRADEIDTWNDEYEMDLHLLQVRDSHIAYYLTVYNESCLNETTGDVTCYRRNLDGHSNDAFYAIQTGPEP